MKTLLEDRPLFWRGIFQRYVLYSLDIQQTNASPLVGSHYALFGALLYYLTPAQKWLLFRTIQRVGHNPTTLEVIDALEVFS